MAAILPVFFTAGLASFMLAGEVQATPRLLWSFAGAVAALLAWNVLLLVSARRRSRGLTLLAGLRPQHYVQACAHTAIFVYWGWHWRQVYDSYYLIVAQLFFAYAFDMLLAWSRRDVYAIGFGPFPVIFSTNLFLWFKPDWFYLQFLMVAVGFAAKELIRWEKDGRETHIFNPSSFSLSVFSIALILTGRSDITWGNDIAVTQFFPPHMYLFLFLIALPGQYLFGVTTMTMSAVVSAYLFGLAYFAATGVYFFYDSYIPIAVFLGMHLLFTDPSTAPRTEPGRLFFGMLYAAGVIVLYAAMGQWGVPTFYDKLLPVPLLNLSIRRLDRVARSGRLRWLDPSRLGRTLTGRRRHLAYIAVWAVVFAGMSGVQGVGDSHPGQWVPFWRQACLERRSGACDYLQGLQGLHCRQGSGWACMEFDRLEQARLRDWDGVEDAVGSAAPPPEDYAIVLRGTKGALAGRTEPELAAMACRQGWPETCAE